MLLNSFGSNLFNPFKKTNWIAENELRIEDNKETVFYSSTPEIVSKIIQDPRSKREKNVAQPPISMFSEHVNIFSGHCGLRSRIANMSGIDPMPATFTNSKNCSLCDDDWPCCCFCHLHKLMQCAMFKMLLCLFCLLLLLSYACQRHTFNAILQSFSFFIVIGGTGR